MGFKDEAWHTHGDLLVPEYGRTAEEARTAFFDAVVADRVVICLNAERESPHRITVTDDPESELRAAGQERCLKVVVWHSCWWHFACLTNHPSRRLRRGLT